ncbi:MAG: phosphotransferase enzyme family protein [Chloroflexota bacterium]
MMKLSLMNRFMGTVDQEYRSPVADAIAAPWGCDPGSVYFWRASANFVCVATIGGARHFLRFNEIGERAPELIRDEVAILNHLLERGTSVNVPVLSRTGNWVEVLTTELGTFAAVMFRALPGKELEFEDAGGDEFERWGTALGRLHREVKSLPPGFAPHRPSWEDILAFAGERIGQDETELRRELDDVRSALAALPQSPDNCGLIHFDFESDNLCWEGDTIAALDFDDCARLWYAADIVYALRDLFKGGPVDLAEPRLARFLAGYRRETALDEAMLANLPLFVRLHRLFFIGRLRRSVDIVDRTAVPEWLAKIADKLSGAVAQYVDDIRNGAVCVR